MRAEKLEDNHFVRTYLTLTEQRPPVPGHINAFHSFVSPFHFVIVKHWM